MLMENSTTRNVRLYIVAIVTLVLIQVIQMLFAIKQPLIGG